MSTVENKGQLITRLAFTGLVDDLARILHIEGSSAYRHMQEMPPFGSGRRSTAFVYCQLVEFLDTQDKKNNSEVSLARMFAEYPLEFYRQLQGRQAFDGDEIQKSNFLNKCVTDSIYMKGKRLIEDLKPGELKEYAEHMFKAATLARELGEYADEVRRNKEAKFTSAPVERERLRAMP